MRHRLISPSRRPLPTRAAALVAALVVMAGCGGPAAPGGDLTSESPRPTDRAVAGRAQPPSPAATREPRRPPPRATPPAQRPRTPSRPTEPGRGGGGGGGAPAPPPAPTPAPRSNRVDDGGRVGTAGRVLLSPDIRAVTIEVDRSGDARLGVDARSILTSRLREHGGKSSTSSAGDSTVPRQDVYSAEDLRRIMAEHRSTRSSSKRLSLYVLVLPGRFEDDQIMGVAFAATAFAVFPEQIAGGLLGVNRDAYEEALLVHELGHLFGLVNLTGEGGFHEDPDHPGHSRNKGSVMFWAVEDISIEEVFQGGPPRAFDEADRREMSRIRAS